MQRVTGLLITALVLLAGCRSAAPDSESTRVITGIVTSIDAGGGFGEVDSFEVKEGEEVIRIFVDPDAVYDFPLAHLNAHRAGAEPVKVEAEMRNGKLVAISIADAET